DRQGARPEDILAGRATPGLAAALAELRQIARAHFDAYRQCTVPSALAPAFLPAELTPLYLDRLARARDPFRVNDLPPWQRQWALWRAARRMGATLHLVMAGRAAISGEGCPGHPDWGVTAVPSQV